MSTKKKAKARAKTSKKVKKGKPGPKTKYGNTKLSVLFNMKVTKTEKDLILKKGGSQWVRERLGLSTGK